MKKLMLLLASAASVLTAAAEGYQVNNFSARQTGMANVGVAMKLGSESLYFNPAAAAHQQSKFDISLGATGVLSYVTATELPSMENDYTSSLREKSDNKMSTPLHVYFNYKPTERLAVGVGFYTPTARRSTGATTGRAHTSCRRSTWRPSPCSPPSPTASATASRSVPV